MDAWAAEGPTAAPVRLPWALTYVSELIHSFIHVTAVACSPVFLFNTIQVLQAACEAHRVEVGLQDFVRVVTISVIHREGGAIGAAHGKSMGATNWVGETSTVCRHGGAVRAAAQARLSRSQALFWFWPRLPAHAAGAHASWEAVCMRRACKQGGGGGMRQAPGRRCAAPAILGDPPHRDLPQPRQALLQGQGGGVVCGWCGWGWGVGARGRGGRGGGGGLA